MPGGGVPVSCIERIALDTQLLYAALDGLPWSSLAVTLDQTIVYWSQGACELLGYAPGTVLGRRCADIPSGLDRYGLTADCTEGCACLRSARVGLVPSPITMGIRCRSGELKQVEVMPVALAPVGALGRLLVYILDVRQNPDLNVRPGWVLSAASLGVGAEAGEVVLTPREMDVLRLVALGWQNEHIATELGVTLNTVRSHVVNLRGKLEAESRLEAVMAAVRLGILELR